MNTGTKIRTVARVVASLNTAAYAVSTAIAGLGFSWLTTAWAILTIALDFVVAFFSHYYNNDFTLEGSIGTLTTREMKAKRNAEMPHFNEPIDSEVMNDDN